MFELKKLWDIAGYLTNPLVLIGLVLLLLFETFHVLLKSKIIQPIPPRQGGKLLANLLRYGFIVALIVIVLGFALEFYNIKKSGSREQIKRVVQKDIPLSCEDQFFIVKIKDSFRGTFYNSHGYNLDFQLQNKLSQPIYVTEIIALFANEEVIKRVPIIRELYENGPSRDYIYYYSIYKKPGIFVENKVQDIFLRGPKFIPKTVEFIIFHSGAQKPSQCKINVCIESEIIYQVPMKNDIVTLQEGIDGHEAILRTNPILKSLPKETVLISVIPGSSKTRMLPSGLYIVDVSEWMLYYRNAGGDGVIIVDEKGERDVPMQRNDELLPHLIDPKRILIGTKDALRIVIDKNLIVTNGEAGWALLRGYTPGDGDFPVWRLPYVGADYLSIFVNAESGAVIPSRLLYKEYSPIETSSTSHREDKDIKGIN